MREAGQVGKGSKRDKEVGESVNLRWRYEEGERGVKRK